ncbi:MAG: hypothetical protein Q8L14_41105 [Myxococcales bacterium]|nr:hypothetical protein [Myxococcales bacterium]
MIAHVLAALVLSQDASAGRRLELEQRLVQLETQSRTSRTFRTLGIVTLVGTGVARELKGVFAAVQRWHEYQALRYEPSGERGFREMEGALIISWIVTGALAGMTAILFGIGFSSDPGDEVARVRDELKTTP